MSFYCEHCGFKNNEIQNTAELQSKGVKYTLKVIDRDTMDRMIVVATKSLVYFPELDFEVPCVKKGMVTTVQGAISIFITDLEIDQPQRKILVPEMYQKI